MFSKCQYCNLKIAMNADEIGFFNVASRVEKRMFLESMVCSECAKTVRMRMTTGGSCACLVRHISGENNSNKNVSRETNGG